MNLPIATLGAAVFGGLAALGVVVMPDAALETLVMGSGLPAVLASAEPPLGLTARAGLALGAGGFIAVVTWLALFVLLGMRGISLSARRAAFGTDEVTAPVVRRADAHPDAPPRPPLLATRDLGDPFSETLVAAPATAPVEAPVSAPISIARPLGGVDEEARAGKPLGSPVPASVEAARPLRLVAETVGSPAAATAPVPPVEQPLPQDLEQPLAAFDPSAILPVPMPPAEPVAPLHRAAPAFKARERFEVFELTPPVRLPVSTPLPPRAVREEAITRPETEASIHALLDRLERGVNKAPHPAPAPAPMRREAERGLEEALVTLRALARRA